MADPLNVSIADVLLDRINAAEDAILAPLSPHVRTVFDTARGVALVAASLHGFPEVRRLDELRAVLATLQTCADNLRLGVVLSVELKQ